jgi:hypothetical protein
MNVAQITEARADFEIIEREIVEPGAGQVRIKVQARGVCHRDELTNESRWPSPRWELSSIFRTAWTRLPTSQKLVASPLCFSTSTEAQMSGNASRSALVA